MYIKFYAKNFLIKIGVLRLRTRLRLLVWKLERQFFNKLRPRKKICVLIRRGEITGLFALFRNILAGIAFADRHSMLPVVDMKNYPNAYLEAEEVGRVNAWEHYFLQPAGISLDEIGGVCRKIFQRSTQWPSRYLAKTQHCSSIRTDNSITGEACAGSIYASQVLFLNA